MGSHRPWHSVVPNSGKRRQWFLCHSFRCQQRSVGWNSARVNGSLPEYVATVVKYIFTIRRFEQHFLFYPRDYKSAIAQSTIKPARLISGATGHLFQVLPGSLPGFQSLELLAWQPPLETTGWLGGQLGLGMHRPNWLCREIGHPWSIKGPLNECRSIISGPIATTNNCQLGSIVHLNPHFIVSSTNFKSKFGFVWR
jgi:hypothetical protein